MEWVEWRFKAEGSAWPEMAQLAGEAAVMANSFLRVLYRGEAFLTCQESRNAAELGLAFLKRYALLARLSVERQQCLWILQPKHHAISPYISWKGRS